MGSVALPSLLSCSSLSSSHWVQSPNIFVAVTQMFCLRPQNTDQRSSLGGSSHAGVSKCGAWDQSLPPGLLYSSQGVTALLTQSKHILVTRHFIKVLRSSASREGLGHVAQTPSCRSVLLLRALSILGALLLYPSRGSGLWEGMSAISKALKRSPLVQAARALTKNNMSQSLG